MAVAWCDDDYLDEPPQLHLRSAAGNKDDDEAGKSTSDVKLKSDSDDAPVSLTAMFAYGSNMNVAQVICRVGSAAVRHLACLRHHRIRFDKRAHPISRGQAPSVRHRLGYANVVECRDPPTTTDVMGGQVLDGQVVTWGILYLVSEEQLATMDQHEGVTSGHYTRETMSVDTFLHGVSLPPVTVDAQVYVACPTMVSEGLLPSDAYLSHLIGGRGLLPSQYSEWLMRHPVITRDELTSGH